MKAPCCQAFLYRSPDSSSQPVPNTLLLDADDVWTGQTQSQTCMTQRQGAQHGALELDFYPAIAWVTVQYAHDACISATFSVTGMLTLTVVMLQAALPASSMSVLYCTTSATVKETRCLSVRHAKIGALALSQARCCPSWQTLCKPSARASSSNWQALTARLLLMGP